MIPQKKTWTIRQARDLANTLANHSWTHAANSDEASSCIYALCDMLEQPGDPTSLRETLVWIRDRMVAGIHDGAMDCYEAIGRAEVALAANPSAATPATDPLLPF
jgi:hypothetical protein